MRLSKLPVWCWRISVVFNPKYQTLLMVWKCSGVKRWNDAAWILGSGFLGGREDANPGLLKEATSRGMDRKSTLESLFE